ncbi:hypothetical protein BCON_0201g00080 [Botryotinia convoluta]|uniref:Uncharacterized protein n=1 Tax=Botryotinia convoluta TaxID=54673 RepID=A0A4Z1HSR0_9HELO|nr:hypothetical protein BCON_0201g00080 [Botryotinia convoluta]
MFHYLFSTTADTGAPGHTKDEFTAEASLLVVAGTNTTAVTKVGFCFYVLRSPRVRLDRTCTRADDIVMGPTVNACKYVHADIDEALRMRTTGLSELQREVLLGGMHIDENFMPAQTDETGGDKEELRVAVQMKDTILLRDTYASFRDGPIVQLRRRV